MKLLIMLSSPPPVTPSVPLTPKYLPQHPIL